MLLSPMFKLIQTLASFSFCYSLLRINFQTFLNLNYITFQRRVAQTEINFATIIDYLNM